MSDTAITVPQSASAGITTVSINHTGQVDRTVTLARLNTGVTLEQFTGQLATDDMAAVNLVSLAGGVNAPAGQTNEVTLELEEGTYVVIAFPQSDEPPLLANFPVSGSNAPPASPPSADVTVDMADFNFTMPDTVSAGSGVWEIQNSGGQWHEMQIIKPEEGFTQEQFFQMMMSDQQPSGPPPFEEIAFFGPSSQGKTGWITVDLQPGTYWAICFLPDIAGDGKSHAEKGMFKEFTVQ